MTPQLNSQQMSAARAILNAYGPSYIGADGVINLRAGLRSVNAKHNFYYDFGYPETSELTFASMYHMWSRHGLASALVTKTGSKTWQENPTLRMSPDVKAKENATEEKLRKHLAKLRFWQRLKDADERSMVGKYAGVILQLGDGQAYDQPVERLPSDFTKALYGVIPAWEGQLQASAWNTDVESPQYGQPTMYQFNESNVDPEQGKDRSFTVHPHRVYIWSEDGTLWGESKLQPVYNALIDWEKQRGSGAEGFWKNAKSQPILQADPDVDFNKLAVMLGVELSKLGDKLDEVVAKWTKGFDETMVLQGMEAKTLQASLISPEHFNAAVVQEIAAAWPIPQKELMGNQTGERASTEDARNWSQTIASRRAGLVIPNVLDIVDRFVEWGALPEADWTVDWADLTAPTLAEKLDIAKRMAEINQAMFASGGAVFTDDEIRDAADFGPLDEDQRELLELVGEEDDDDDSDPPSGDGSQPPEE